MNKTKVEVDKNVSVPESVRKAFGEGSHRVVPGPARLDAVARFVANEIDLALLDIGLPTKSGWETWAKSTQFFFDFGA
ncbi:MAG TPA: hypothetical protein VGR14_15030 [Verrucomicrobiae bacterium]|nr:hypothetical protein [Verrucomicrobiae bacterium]